MKTTLIPDTTRIVLCGFMGTGKTTTGRLIASRLKGTFVDLDEEIEKRMGMPIRDIFEKHGEEAFRRAEREACARLDTLQARVLAVGGGTVLHPDNLQHLEAWGKVVLLTASEKEILRRITSSPTRPLLQGHSQASLRRLLDERSPLYDKVPWQFDTSIKTPEQVSETLLFSLSLDTKELKRLSVPTTRGHYDIVLAPGALRFLGELLCNSLGYADTDVVVVTNPEVGTLYGERVVGSLERAGFEAHLVCFPAGEAHKTLNTVQHLYELLVEKGLDRRGVVVALGGGIVGDMAGFAAATYLRGVRFVQVPTTLLAMVDSSLGGKTGVDLPEGKNLVGAFKQPDLVVADPEVLGSLSASERTFGMAEVLKHAIIADSWLFSRIEKGNPAVDTTLLLRSIRVKVDVVGDDPWERGRRAILNLGHTFAHAFEKASDFRLSHGAAVAVGLRASARLGCLVGVTKKGVEERILRALRVCGLPVGFDALSLQRVWEAMQVDKKRIGNRLRFVVPREIGEVMVIEAPDPGAVEEALRLVLVRGSV